VCILSDCGVADGETRLSIDGVEPCFCGGSGGHGYGDGEHGIWATGAVQLEDVDTVLENGEGALPSSAGPILLWGSYGLQPSLYVQRVCGLQGLPLELHQKCARHPQGLRTLPA